MLDGLFCVKAHNYYSIIEMSDKKVRMVGIVPFGIELNENVLLCEDVSRSIGITEARVLCGEVRTVFDAHVTVQYPVMVCVRVTWC